MVDLEKYSGKWYEIFKIPFKWEQGCVKSTANYEVLNTESITLKNTCYFENGKSYSRSGKGVINHYEEDEYEYENEDDVMLKMTIEFTDGLPSDGPSPYWIHWTNYNFSVVGGPSEDHLWLLSRDENISKRELVSFMSYVDELGYDISRIEIQDNISVI